MLTIGSTVLGVSDVRRAYAFWTGALGYVPRDPGPLDDDWVVLVPPDGAAGAHLSLMESGTPPQDAPRTHLDLYATDQQAEVTRLLDLGAEEVMGWKYPPDADFVVLADPDGNRFCVVQTPR
ncbi:VOC family protein [Streptomyces sp. cg35]|uniref:VOC family protein n=1 Tax=Streptomyces sp. cg35 TaxID=3421650 RepID=UPI003D174272